MLNDTRNTLKSQLPFFKADIQHFLSAALAITEHVKTYHDNESMIKTLSSNTIFWNGSTPITSETIMIDPNTNTEILLLKPYQSPEQHHISMIDIDYRSDLYSLGIIFHEMLTLSTPKYFKESGIKLNFPHDQSIPKTITLMIQKLLFTYPEHRYQSAKGLLNDLQECQTQLDKTDTIPFFLPGKHDKRKNLLFGNYLYGRDTEQKTLITAYNRIKKGQSDCIFIQGYSGVGKTSLVTKTLLQNTQENGFFITGKHDPVQNKSHEAIIQALTELINQVHYTHPSNTTLAEKLNQSLYPNAELLAHLIPNLNKIMEIEPTLPQAPIEKEKKRVFQCIKTCIHCIISYETKPLVIFLDDLHQADTESLTLINQLIKAKIPYVLLIIAFRNNECPHNHPIYKWIKETNPIANETIIKLESLSSDNTHKKLCDTLQHTESSYQNHIQLKGIPSSHVKNQISDIFQINAEQPELASLSELIYNKTHGNPFFIRHLLQHMKDTQLITFNNTKQKWEWKIAKLKTIDVSDNVADIAYTSIQNLPNQTQEILTKAACLGVIFTLKTLSIITKTIPTTLMLYLWHAENKEIIVKSHPNQTGCNQENDIDHYSYKFLHDKIQEAAYNTINPKQKEKYHWEIGSLLYQAYHKTAEFNVHVLMIASHINQGLSCIQSEHDISLVTHINLRAAQKAKQNLAYQTMYHYLHNGIQHLPPNHLQNPTSKTFEYYEQYLQAHYLCGYSKEIKSIFETIKTAHFTPIEHAKIYKIYVEQTANAGMLDDAINIGLEGLSLLNITIPKHPSQWYLIRNYLIIKWKLNITNLKKLKKRNSPYTNATIPLLVSTAVASHTKVNPKLLFCCILKIMSLSLNYGHNDSAYAFMGYAYFLCSKKLGSKISYDLAVLAIKLLKNHDNLEIKIRATHIFESFINPWHSHFLTCKTKLYKNYELALAAGDLYFEGFSFFISHMLGINTTMPTTTPPTSLEITPLIKNYCNLLNDYANVLSKKITIPQSSYFNKTGISYKEPHMIMGYYYQLKQSLLFIFQDYSHALEIYTNYNKEIKKNMIPSSLSDMNFYTFLSATKLLPNHPFLKRIYYLAISLRLLLQMKQWSRLCKRNFYHRYLLMKAEWKHLFNQNKAALLLYKQAISAAETADFILDLAIIHEFLANFYQSTKQPSLEKTHISQAIHYYDTYGAHAKTKHLKNPHKNNTP